ncbi:MAG TPA: hypothetical protein VFA03_06425 [Acetobacteraceae bacterium]|nr:hypothetical protein [Acetobacteraceae bacterium]
MNASTWIRQVTTGGGFATILAALSGVASNAITWQQAVLLLVGGLAGIIWPENRGLADAAEKAARDLETAAAASVANAAKAPSAGAR